MSSNNILTNALQDNGDTTIEPPSFIEITKKTVRFGSNIYQFRNITGFGLAEAKNGNVVPIKLILIGFAVGLFLANIPDFRFWGIFIALAAIVGIIVNSSQPKRYGLQLELNSGRKRVFITRDLEGVKKVVSVLYNFMESDQEGSFN
ncbi:DUF6232 family protein [Scytonema sp. PCC 10023]|uniref:DUF6232 family protein n=1 Tax=Scytonema sp. PCC 10023 TaxID=1680591 RepID=UPI0039C60287